MKSKEEIHLAIATLTMMVFKAEKNNDKLRARKVASALCWVMDYPSDFEQFMDKVKELNPLGELGVSPEKLDEIIQKSIVKVLNTEEEGHSE